MSQEPNFDLGIEPSMDLPNENKISTNTEMPVKVEDVEATVDYVMGGAKPEIVNKLGSSRDRLYDLINVVSAMNMSRMAKAIEQANKVNDLLFDDANLANMDNKELIQVSRNLDTTINNVLEFTRRVLTSTEVSEDPHKEILDKLLTYPKSKLDKIFEKLSEDIDEEDLALDNLGAELPEIPDETPTEE